MHEQICSADATEHGSEMKDKPISICVHNMNGQSITGFKQIKRIPQSIEENATSNERTVLFQQRL